MDRNNLIGFTLMAVLLFVYFIFFAPEPGQPTQPLVQDSTQAKQITRLSSPSDSTSPINPDTIPLREIVLENEEVRITLSNHGAVITKAQLKNFKSYSGDTLTLISKGTSTFRTSISIDGKETDLNTLNYQSEVSLTEETKTARFVAVGSKGERIEQTWTLPAKGFVIDHKVKTVGINPQKEFTEWQWINRMPLVEKDLNDSRTKTAINFHTPADDETDGTSESSLDQENMSLPQGTDWVGMKQKFFLSAVISKEGFSGGEIETFVPAGDEKTVKTGKILVKIPTAKITGAGADLRYYLGPNDYKTLGEVAPGFRENVYLGWPPVKWVNEYLIVPVFLFLTKYFSNYGLIIIILVIIIRLVLLPLSYKSYLGMAKMRLLKPELDELKKKFPDDQMKFSQEQMKLFNEAGASPFAGCIPLLLQMPILFAMFYLFPSCIEFRQQTLPFAEDISTYDSVLSLPFAIPFMGSHISIYTLLMTISTLAITWQNNQISTVDGPMKSLSYIMPLVFFFVLNSFPASLSFYYLIGNVASFGQQILIKRFVDEDKIKEVMEAHRKKMAASPNSGKSAFMSKLSDALKASEEARKKNKRS